MKTDETSGMLYMSTDVEKIKLLGIVLDEEVLQNYWTAAAEPPRRL